MICGDYVKDSDDRPLGGTERLDRRITFLRTNLRKLRGAILFEIAAILVLLVISLCFVLLAYSLYDYAEVWGDPVLTGMVTLIGMIHNSLVASATLYAFGLIYQWWMEARKEASDES